MSVQHAWKETAPMALGSGSRLAEGALESALTALCGTRIQRIAAGAEIVGQGEPADKVYRVLSGVVRISRVLADGRRQICDFLHTGDVLGPEAGIVHALAAEAVTPVTLQALERRALSARAETDVNLTGELWRLSIDWFTRSQSHLMILAHQGALERVAAFLVNYARRIGATDAFELPMTRQDIGDYLGLTLHTVSRTLCLMQAQGLIELDHRHVHLRKMDRLLDMVA